jgi:hypothetical protein
VKPDNAEICTAEIQEVAQSGELELEQEPTGLGNLVVHTQSSLPFYFHYLHAAKKQMVRVPRAA